MAKIKNGEKRKRGKKKYPAWYFIGIGVLGILGIFLVIVRIMDISAPDVANSVRPSLTPWATSVPVQSNVDATESPYFYYVSPPPIELSGWPNHQSFGKMWMGNSEITGKLVIVFDIQIFVDENMNPVGDAQLILKEIWTDDVSQFINGKGLFTIEAFADMPLMEGKLTLQGGREVDIPRITLPQGKSQFSAGNVMVYPLQNDQPDFSRGNRL
jgi:hypothetical protein